jgi:AAA domain
MSRNVTVRTAQRTLEVRWGNEVQTTPIDWLWDGWLPRGVVAVLDGDPGLGKSSLALDLIARITTGREFPGASPSPPGPLSHEGRGGVQPPEASRESQTLENVEHPSPPGGRGAGGEGDAARDPRCCVVVALEDSIDKVVKPRLEAAGADVGWVAFLGGVREDGPDGQVTELLQLPRDLQLIVDLCRQVRPALLVIDPLFAVLGYDERGRFIKANDDQSVRQLLARLKILAEETETTILLIRHLNKASGGTALKRGSGTIAISGLARAALVVGRDPDDESKRVLAMVKSNYGVEPPSWRYVLGGPGAISRVEWLGECDLKPDDLVRSVSAEKRASERLLTAQDFLETALEAGPKTWEELVREAEAEGISEITLRRARSEKGLERVGHARHVKWQLPFRMPPLVRMD